MFDSPFEHCPVCGQMVVLDQTQSECAAGHTCAPGTKCPLQQYFTGVDADPFPAKENLREQDR